MKSLIYIFQEFNSIYSFFYKHTYAKTDNVNKTKFKPQTTVQKSEKNIFNWVTLPTLLYVSNMWKSSNLLDLINLVYTKKCSFAHIINEGNLTFRWDVKNLIFHR